MRKFTCDEFLDHECEYINDYIQESHWYNAFDADDLADKLIDSATYKQILLTDMDSFDWVKELENIYNVTEKGLS